MASTSLASLLSSLPGQAPLPPVPPWPASNVPPASLAGNYVFLDSKANMIVVVIPGSLRGQPNQPAEIIRLPFRNRFYPQVTVSIRKFESDRYRYVYTFANVKPAINAVKGWTVAAGCGDQRSGIEDSPSGWRCTRIDDQFAKVYQYSLPWVSTPGCAVVCFLDGQQSPNSPAASVSMVSELKPGFTTASAENYPPFAASQEWPEVILEQLAKLGDVAWSSKHTMTLGPRFGRGAGPAIISADFLQGLAVLIQTGRLAGDSKFVRELRVALEGVAPAGRTEVPHFTSASTELEREIAEAVALSLED